METLIKLAFKVLPKRHLTYLAAACAASLGLIEIEQALGELAGLSLWPDLPNSLSEALGMMAIAGGFAGSRRAQDRVIAATQQAITEAAAMPAKDVGAKTPGLVGALSSRNQRGATFTGTLMVLAVMTAMVGLFCGCGLVKQRQGVSVSVADKYADAIEKITVRNTEAAIQGIIIAESLRGRACITPEEDKAIGDFLERFSDVDESKLEQLRQATADLRLEIQKAREVNSQ